MPKIANLRHVQQSNDWFCGPASVEIVLRYYGLSVKQEDLAKPLGTTEQNGTRPDSIMTVLGLYDLHPNPILIEDADIWMLQYAVRNKRPVIVAYQEWDDGHYAVVCGYDKDRIYLCNPGFETICGYEYFDFIRRWHDCDADGKLYRKLAIVV